MPIPMNETVAETSVPVSEAGPRFAEILERVVTGKERVRLTRRGRKVAVILSEEEFEALEDAADLVDARLSKAADDASGEAPIPLAVLKKTLRL